MYLLQEECVSAEWFQVCCEMTSNGSFYTDYNMTTLDMEVTRGLNCPEISEDHQYALGKMSFILEGKKCI